MLSALGLEQQLQAFLELPVDLDVALHPQLQLLVLLPVEIQLFVEDLVDVGVLLREDMAAALQFVDPHLQLRDLLVMLLNQESSVSLQLLVQLIAAQGVVNDCVFADDFLKFFVEVVQSLVDMLIAVAVPLRDVCLLAFYFRRKAELLPELLVLNFELVYDLPFEDLGGL